MKKYMKFIWLFLFAVLLIGTFVFLWKKSQPEKEKFEIIAPVKKNIEKKTVVTGKVEPRDEVLIKPQISGIISQLLKEAGQTVKAGEIIAQIKVIPEMGTLNSAESRVNIARISKEQTAREFNRTQDLHRAGVISDEEFEKAQTQYKQALEEMQNAQDNLEIVKDGISKRTAAFSNTQIRSTITGMILDIPVKVGNSVIQSNNFNDGTTIASIADMSDMIFKGQIDETEVGRLKEGMEISLIIGALQDIRIPAILEYISPKGTEDKGAILFEIKAAASIPDSLFVRAGYSANAEIILDKRTDVLSVPESTIEFTGDSAFVQLVTDSLSMPQLFEKRTVETGLSDGIYIEIKKGLSLTERIKGNKIINK